LREVKVVLMMTYWELNPNKDIKEIAKVGAQLAQSGKWPPEGVKVLAWYITPSTPCWGVTIFEAENEEAAFNAQLLWTKAMPGFFTCHKTSPALPTEKVIPLALS
jgi:hypothetical protein